MKFVLQDKKRQSQQGDFPVQHAVFQERPLRAHEDGNRPDRYKSNDCEKDAAEQRGVNHHGKQLVCPFLLALAQSFGDQSAAAGAEHETGAAQNDQNRHNKIDGGKGCFPHKVGYEQTVYYAVDCREDQHDNGRERKTE